MPTSKAEAAGMRSAVSTAGRNRILSLRSSAETRSLSLFENPVRGVRGSTEVGQTSTDERWRSVPRDRGPE